ncbi:MAG TPA: hypothetical protein VF615_05755 [Longimicrobiaceae bacterium]
MKLRLAFGEIPRALLVEWPSRESALTIHGTGTAASTTTISGAMSLAARAALASLGPAWEVIDRGKLEKHLVRGIRRVYAEITELGAAAGDLPTRRLLMGLAKQHPAYSTMAKSRLYAKTKTIKKGSLFPYEAQVFAPSGAALHLVYVRGVDNRLWRGANCRRRGVVYSLAVHRMLIGHLRAVVQENEEGGTKVETAGLRHSPEVRRVAQGRLRALTCLQARPNYAWVRHYSRLHLDTDKILALPEDVKNLLGSEVLRTLVRQLGYPRESQVDSPGEE